MMAELSVHAEIRAAQRRFSLESIHYIITYGQCFYKAGAKIHYLRFVDVPEWDRFNDHWIKLVGSAVILTKDGRTVLTVWRNRKNGLKRIKRKPDYSCQAGPMLDS
jgi:hypothetical protein